MTTDAARSLPEHKAIVERIPHIRKLTIEERGWDRCQGYAFWRMPRSIRLSGADKWESYRCKAGAQWEFRALKASGARSGLYCWHHLFTNGINYDSAEAERVNKWLRRKGYLPDE